MHGYMFNHNIKSLVAIHTWTAYSYSNNCNNTVPNYCSKSGESIPSIIHRNYMKSVMYECKAGLRVYQVGLRSFSSLLERFSR